MKFPIINNLLSTLKFKQIESFCVENNIKSDEFESDMLSMNTQDTDLIKCIDGHIIIIVPLYKVKGYQEIDGHVKKLDSFR